MTTPGLVVGIDLGGTGTRFVAVEASTFAVTARSSARTPSSASATEVAAFLRGSVADLTSPGRLLAIGIGASGPVDAAGVIRNPDTLPAFTGLPVLEMLDGLAERATLIDNDAVCAALGEHAVGAAVGVGRSLHVTLGTGIGVCLLQGDTPFRNGDGSHPEAGHLTVASATRPCYCGRRSCWEQAASRQALQRSAAELLGRAADDPTVLAELASRASAGDHTARTVLDTYGRRVAEGLASLLTAYGPDLVVLGGSAAAYLDLFRPALTDELDRLVPWVPRSPVVASALDDFGGAVGAAALARANL